MASNTQSYFGFRQISGNGSSPTFEQVTASVPSTAGAIYFGDPVTLQADGTIAQSASTGTSQAALGIAGIFQGCKYLSVSQKRTVWSNYWPGSDMASGNFAEAYIVNDPNARFIVCGDSTGFALVDVNTTVGFVINSSTANAVTGISAAYLDSTTVNAGTATNNPFKIFGVSQAPAGYPGSLNNSQAYDWVIVGFNNVSTRNFTGV